jgi:hypothetical protein
MNQEILKTPGGKGQIRKIQNNKKKERMEERKRKDFSFYVCGGSHTRVFPIGQERPRTTTLV